MEFQTLSQVQSTQCFLFCFLCEKLALSFLFRFGRCLSRFQITYVLAIIKFWFSCLHKLEIGSVGVSRMSETMGHLNTALPIDFRCYEAVEHLPFEKQIE